MSTNMGYHAYIHEYIYELLCVYIYKLLCVYIYMSYYMSYCNDTGFARTVCAYI